MLPVQSTLYGPNIFYFDGDSPPRSFYLLRYGSYSPFPGKFPPGGLLCFSISPFNPGYLFLFSPMDGTVGFPVVKLAEVPYPLFPEGESGIFSRRSPRKPRPLTIATGPSPESHLLRSRIWFHFLRPPAFWMHYAGLRSISLIPSSVSGRPL